MVSELKKFKCILTARKKIEVQAHDKSEARQLAEEEQSDCDLYYDELEVMSVVEID